MGEAGEGTLRKIVELPAGTVSTWTAITLVRSEEEPPARTQSTGIAFASAKAKTVGALTRRQVTGWRQQLDDLVRCGIAFKTG
jgi:hypothetical protein